MDFPEEQVPAQAAPGAGPQTRVPRERPEPPEARRQLVASICSNVKAAQSHWAGDFRRMRENRRFAAGEQWPGEQPDKYVVNVTNRHIQQQVAKLYGRNPRIVARRAERMHSRIWDGTMQTLLAAQQLVQAAQQAPEQVLAAGQGDMVQTAMLVVQDAIQTVNQEQALSRVAQTMELLLANQIKEQPVPFKQSMKRLVRRGLTEGVAYVRPDFQRQTGLGPDEDARLPDVRTRIAQIRRVSDDMADGEIDRDSQEVARLEAQLGVLESSPDVIVREGLVFSFPRSDTIIPDTRCEDIQTFEGCDWVAQEFELTAAQIQEVYGVDVGAIAESRIGEGGARSEGSGHGAAWELPRTGDVRREGEGHEPVSTFMVYEVFDKRDLLVYTVCDGYPDFLRDPAPPVARLERFWPWFALVRNPGVDPSRPYPPSDVDLMRNAQQEINRARQGLREHRLAARPKVVASAGALSENDKDLVTQPYQDGVPLLELQGLAPGQKVQDLLQTYAGPGIDPGLYETGSSFEDVLRATGTQEANLGGIAGGTATESAIAEQSRTVDTNAGVDALDDLLTELARASGQILLGEMSPETVKDLIGPGAVWPEYSRAEIQKELFLDIEAGSSGRPNQDVEVRNIKEMLPLFLQMPGVSPEWLLKQLITRLDDKLPVHEAMLPGAPSIIAANAMLQAQARGAGAGAEAGGQAPGQTQDAQGDPSRDPAQQGGQGANNSPDGGAPTPSRGPQDQIRPGGGAAVPGPLGQSIF